MGRATASVRFTSKPTGSDQTPAQSVLIVEDVHLVTGTLLQLLTNTLFHTALTLPMPRSKEPRILPR